MIRKLRWKFVAINMTIVTLLLTAICAFIFLTVTDGLRDDSMSVLHRVIDPKNVSITVWQRETERGSESIWSRSPLRDQEVSLPYFTVAVGRDGETAVIDSQFYDLNDEDALLAVVQEGLSATEESGLLHSYHLRYLRQATAAGWRIAFTDVTQEQSTTRSLILNMLLIGLSALVGFFFISLLLARWAIRPVERSWKQQRQFVADASHELKTPLTVVLSNVDMLREYGQPQKERERRWMDNIRASSLQMKELVEEMLTLARSDNLSRRTPVRERVNFSDLVTDCTLLFEPMVFESGKLLEEDVAEDLWTTGDPGKLKRLVEVLLDNAQKYARPRGRIRVTLASEGSRRLRLSVYNEGEPIPPEQLDRIFERFYRADPARTTNGFGLGLAIARRSPGSIGGGSGRNRMGKPEIPSSLACLRQNKQLQNGGDCGKIKRIIK